MTQIFDYEKALAITDGDIELLRELIDLFKEQSPQLLAEIDRAIDAEQAEELHQAAHSIKGALANLGAMAAYETALTLEIMGMNNDLVEARSSYEKLLAKVQKFEHETETFEGVQAQ